MGALFQLDEVLLNPQIRTISTTLPGTFRNAEVENQEQSGDRSQKDPHPELELFAYHASNLSESDPESSHMVTGVPEEILYCSPGTSSGK